MTGTATAVSAESGAKRVAVYTRVSNVGAGGTESSTARQLPVCERYAEAQGWTVTARHTDRGISGWSGVDRPGWLALEQDVVAGSVDVVLVFAISRAARNTIRLLKFKETCDEHGVELHSATEQISGPYGQVFLTILAALAELESQSRSDRLTAKELESAQAGKPSTGGPRPWGYADHSRTNIVPEEAALIRECVNRALAGASCFSLARWLNDAGHRTTAGNRFHPNVLRRSLLAPSLAGLRYHGPTDTTTHGTWQGIVTPEEREHLIALIGHKSGGGITRQGNRTSIVSGLLRCAVCGAKMVVAQQSVRCDRSMTNGCGQTRANRRQIEKAVLALSERLYLARKLAEAQRPATPDPVPQLIAEQSQLDDRHDELAELFAEGSIDRRALMVGIQRLDKRRAEIDVALRAAGDLGADAREHLNDAIGAWMENDKMDAGQIAAVQSVIQQDTGDTIWVSPVPPFTRGFDPERLSLSRPAEYAV